MTSVARPRRDEQMLPPEGHPTVLIIDDDPDSRHFLAATLSVEGFDVLETGSPDEAVAQAVRSGPSLILFAMALGGAPGLAACRRIGALSSAPVIAVTACADELDAVEVLEAGAADHLLNPPRPRELTARIRAVLRRVGDLAPTTVEPGPPIGVHELGPVRIDTELRRAWVRGRDVELSRKEFDLLAVLVADAGNVVTRAQCMQRIWCGGTRADSRTLDTHVKRLRKKVELVPSEPRHVLTVRGIGYRFKP